MLLDFGPGAGRLGGQIVAAGTPDEVSASAGSVTGPYLSGKKAIAVPKNAAGCRMQEARMPEKRKKSKPNDEWRR